MKTTTKITLIITTIFIVHTTIAQEESCKKQDKTTDLNTINKCKSSLTKIKTEDSNRIQLKKRNHKITKNNTLLINTLALERKISDEEVKNTMDFNSVDRIPTFKKCANLKNKKRLNCFNNEMTKHIEKHFHYPKKAIINTIKGRVWVRFIIDKKGKVSNIKAIGPKNGAPIIMEAKRVISNLPQFLPGKNNKKKVPVKYSIPINFK